MAEGGGAAARTEAPAAPGNDPVTTRLADRYGRSRGGGRSGRARLSTRAKIALGAAFAVLVGVVSWVAYVNANPATSSMVSGYDVRSDSAIDITVKVDRDGGKPTECTVQALGRDMGVVGTGTVRLTQGDDTGSVLVTTTSRAAGAKVVSCHLTG